MSYSQNGHKTILRRVVRWANKPIKTFFPSTSQKTVACLRVWQASLEQLKANNFGSCLGEEKATFFRGQVAEALSVPGDIIECGVFQGGSLMMIADACRQANVHKRIYALDSFTGLNPDEFQGDLQRGLVKTELGNFRHNSLTLVRIKARRLRLHPDIRFVKGYFKNTLKSQLNRTQSICFAHIDCDLYDPVRLCAEQIYSKMSPGGIMLFDDLTTSYKGARDAFEEFTSRVNYRKVTLEAGMGSIII